MIQTVARPIDEQTVPAAPLDAVVEPIDDAKLTEMVPPESVAPLRSFNIEESTEKILRHCRRTVADIVEIGRELNWAKANLEHGLWEEWVEDRLPFSVSTASRFMTAAKRYANLALTQDFDEREFMAEVWGNKPQKTEVDPQVKVQRDLTKRFGKAIDEITQVVPELNQKEYWDAGLRQQFTLLADLVANQGEYFREFDARLITIPSGEQEGVQS